MSTFQFLQGFVCLYRNYGEFVQLQSCPFHCFSCRYYTIVSECYNLMGILNMHRDHQSSSWMWGISGSSGPSLAGRFTQGSRLFRNIVRALPCSPILFSFWFGLCWFWLSWMSAKFTRSTLSLKLCFDTLAYLRKWNGIGSPPLPSVHRSSRYAW